jgi:hypothetical protein
LRLDPEDEITLDLLDMDNAGGGVNNVDPIDRGIPPNVADPVKQRALYPGVVFGDDRGRKPWPAGLCLIRWRLVQVVITGGAPSQSTIE